MGDNADEDTEITEVSRGRGNGGNSNNRYDQHDPGAGHGQGQWDFQYNRGRGQENSFQADNDSGMEMTLITVTETTGIEIPMVKVIPTGVEDGIIIIGVKDIVIGAEGEDGIPIRKHHNPGYQQQSQFSNPNHYHPPPMGHQYRYPIPYEQYSYPNNNNNNNTNLKCHQLHLNKLQISVSCVTVKAIMIINANLQVISWPVHKKPSIKGRSYSHQDPNHGEWSQGDNDTNDPNGQPFQ